MKKKVLKIAAFTLAIALIVSVCIFANSLIGNPLSKALAKNTAEKYVEETYSNTDYELEDVKYSFKDGYYHAYISSPSSIDTHFELWINGFGKLEYDNYDYHVTSGWNTAMRIDKDYRNTVSALFESKSFPYDAYIAYGEIAFTTEEYKDNTTIHSYALVSNELTADGFYNANELGKSAGKLTVHIDDNNVSNERMAEILLGIRECFDKSGIGFYVIDCVLEYPRDENGFAEDGRVEVMEFLYSDIYEDGLVERVAAANEAAKEYYGFGKEEPIE